MMMKKVVHIVAVIFVLTLFGCDQNEMIKKKIISKKEKINKLENEIKELESELKDTIQVNDFIPVEVKEMVPEEFNHFIIAYGEVEAVDYALVSPEMPGQIKKIHVNEGQRVSNGQLLITLNTESLESQINQIETNLELATETFEKQKRLWEQNIGSEMQYLQAKANKESLEAQLKATKAQLRMSQIRAPFTGYVDKIYQKAGELATQMQPVLEMVNMDKLSVTADISENYIGSIQKGQVVQVSFSAMPDIIMDVPVTRVSNVIDKANRTFEIEVKMDNPQQQIKPFMVSTIKINDYSNESALVIPSIVMKRDISGNYVYITELRNDMTVATKKYVETGLSFQDKTEIRDGLKPGENVIVAGYNVVSSGIPVEVR
jgi:RND family efflux transporter MFP subunit